MTRSTDSTFKLNFLLEALEERKMLAGNVDVALSSSGSLNITGDSADNIIEISDVSTNTIRVQGSDGTSITFNGVVSDSHDLFVGNTLSSNRPSVNSVRINLKGGNDELRISGVEVRSGLNARLGSGENELHVGENRVVGDLNVSGGSSSDYLDFYENEFEGNIKVSLRAAETADEFIFDENTLAGNLTVLQGSGKGYVDIGQSTIDGRIRIQTGGSDDQVTFYHETFLEQDVQVSLSSGDDLMTIIDVVAYDRLSISSGAGDDVIYLESSTASDAQLDSVLISTGRDNDMIYADNLLVDGEFEVRMGSGDDVFTNLSESQFFDGITFQGGTGYDGVQHTTWAIGARTFIGIEWTTFVGASFDS